MTPIFNADVRLVGFFDGTYVFDLDNEWVAFHDRGNVFSTSGRWLGPLHGGSFLDTDGLPAGWLPGSRPSAVLKPITPMNAKRPLTPMRPLRPRTPLPPPVPLPPVGGWSPLSWAQWLGKAPLAQASGVDVAALPIHAITAADLDAFYRYLGEQLAENGREGRWFMPLAPTGAGVAAETRQSFHAGMDIAVGAPGWRRGWVARDAHGAVAGHIDLRAHPEAFTGHRCQLGMGVRHDLRRLGLAGRLLAHATQWASAQGLKWIDLQVLSANEAAVAFYLREGFLMQGGGPDKYVIDGASLGEIRMARRVAAPVA
jgi:ribosomal protein S18 acetylase RimI-like enzyme